MNKEGSEYCVHHVGRTNNPFWAKSDNVCYKPICNVYERTTQAAQSDSLHYYYYYLSTPHGQVRCRRCLGACTHLKLIIE